MICACVVAQAFAGGSAPSSTGPQQSPAESPPAASVEAPAQSSPSAASTSDKPGTDPKSSASQSPTTTNAVANPPAKVTLVDKTLTDAQVKQLLARGYKPQGHGDDVVYCRREQQLGSRFETRICRSAAQIVQDELNSKELTETMQRTQPSPSGR